MRQPKPVSNTLAVPALLAYLVCPLPVLGDEWECSPELVFFGNQASASYARAVAGADDVDSDGHDDLLVGIPGFDGVYGDAGKALVYSGATGQIIRAWQGETTWSLLGHAVDGIGDSNGDGVSDVIVAAPGYDGFANQIGKVYVYSGATGQLVWSRIGEGYEYQFGWDVAGAGDVDGDQTTDVIVGARAPGPQVIQAGRAYVYSGADGRLIWSWEGEHASDWFGTSVDGAGDVDGDGFADLLVGAPKTEGPTGKISGAAFLFSGCNGRLLWKAYGEVGSSFGSSVSSAGDLDGDSVGDWMVGAPNFVEWTDHSPRGMVALYSGRTGLPLMSWTGEEADDYFGYDVANSGDIDNDGWPDLIVGALYGGDAVAFGKVYIFSGADGGLVRSWIGESFLDLFGTSVSGAGDVNNDGYEDVIVGAQCFDGPAGFKSGKAYVFAGTSRADVDCDLTVGLSDLQLLLREWGPCPKPCGNECLADVNGDCTVDVIDLLTLLASWG